MKLKPIAITSFALSLFLTACVSQPPDIDTVTTHNLGTVTKGKLAIADLPVRNLGKKPLTVEAISTSCGCTTATLSSMTIPAGGEALLHIEYDSNAHAEDIGEIERYVFIASNDPDEADLRIEFRVFVEKE